MKRTYEIAEQGDKRGLAEFLKRESQFLLPMVELVERTELAIDEVITVMGRATLEAVLAMSAEGVAGPKQAGKARPAGEAVWYGRQSGQVYLSDRKVQVERPRLRRRGQGTGGEVEVPAYEAMNRPGPVGQRMLEILLAGVSTRKYARVIPAMAETVGVSRSAVSRETIEASERVLEELMERRLDGWDLLVIYLDGMRAAWKLEAKEGEQKLDQFARWLERDHPSAAASLREGLGEMFTINRLGLPPRLRRCLTSTNLIDSTHSGVRQKTHRVTKSSANLAARARTSFHDRRISLSRQRRRREPRSCVQRPHALIRSRPVAPRLRKLVARLHPHPVFGRAPADVLQRQRHVRRHARLAFSRRDSVPRSQPSRAAVWVTLHPTSSMLSRISSPKCGGFSIAPMRAPPAPFHYDTSSTKTLMGDPVVASTMAKPIPQRLLLRHWSARRASSSSVVGLRLSIGTR